MNCVNLWRSAIVFAVSISLTQFTLAQVIPGQARVDRGRILFQKAFAPVEEPSGPDGLGPLFNARACSSCHWLGGAGGAGLNRENVQILSAVSSGRLRQKHISQNRIKLGKIHPALTQAGSVVLHRFSTDPRYEQWRERMLGLHVNKDARSRVRLRKKKERAFAGQGPVKSLPEIDGFSFVLTERNTPALFGANLIDSISTDTLIQLAQTQSRINDGITGRVSKIKLGIFGSTGSESQIVGRFGWRGQMGSLREFVLTACAVEMGMQVRDHEQSVGPFAARHHNGVDLSTEEADDMLAFVQSLKPLPESPPLDAAEKSVAHFGRNLFGTIGCAKCHIPDLEQVQGIYSDLLLHDMGPALSDPVPALPGIRPAFADVTDEASFREWRTPPLWGVADTAPYMHDGRAENLHEAILAHAGEAVDSMRRYRKFDDRNKTALIKFLLTLGVSARDEMMRATDRQKNGGW